ncbi:MAG: hypothetical protein KY444_04320, partial [Gemmatimonadetes bacterium]|nr:hypothetical protein [Gemmatimonadota bacterium]
IIGGVLTSTLLTLLVIPTVWELLDDLREALLGRFRRTPSGGHGGGHGESVRTVPVEPRLLGREPAHQGD